MSIKSDKAKLEQILKYIEDIFIITKKHNGIGNTLSDMEGQYAVMLCLGQIGELLGKIESSNIRSKLPVQHASGLRNIIVHNYDGVDLVIVEGTLKKQIPELKKIIISILDRL